MDRADQALAEAIAQIVLNKRGGDKAFTPPHGPDGLLTYPGVRPDMYSLVPRVGSFTASLPMLPSVNAKERFEFLTGVTAQTGSNPTDSCGTAPTSGKAKVGQIDVEFGEFYKATEQIKVGKAGQRVDRADVNRRLRNPINELSENPFVPMPPAANAESFNTYLGKAFLEFGQGVMLDFAYADWRGDPTKDNTQTYLGWIREYLGLDGWIKTGYTDVVSGNAMTSLDSQVITYNAALGASFVQSVVDAYDVFLMEAEIKGTPNARGVFVIHPRMKAQLFEIWACNYHTARCLPTEDNGRVLDVTEVTRLRDAMRNGNYLLINGEQVPVMFDAGIAATQNQGTGIWTADFYFVPMDDGLGNPLTYREYVPMDESNQDVREIIASTGGEYRVMNGGLYLMTWEKVKFCISYYFTAHVRLILERPDLAFRIDDVQFDNRFKITDPFPGSTYHRDGGTTFRDN